jgi:uncharacterized protein YkwD
MTCDRTRSVRGTFDGMAARRGHGQSWTQRVAVQALILMAAAAAFSSPAAAAKSLCAHASAAPVHLSTPAASHALRCLINGVRRAHHLRPVRVDRHLRSAARRHANDMAGRDYFAHGSPGGTTMESRVRSAGYLRSVREWWLGEAIAWGNGGAGAPRAILRGLLNSPPHRAILLDPGFRDLGIGVARGAPRGAGAGALTIALDFGRVRR